MKKTILASLLALGLAAPAQAAITYIDATHGAGGNTTLVGGAQWDPLTANQGTDNDGVWALRAFGNSASIYQNLASGSAGDNAHRLQTNVTGLNPLGIYNVYAYFWSDGGSWGIEASLSDLVGPLPLFDGGGSAQSPAPAAVGTDFVVAPLLSEGGRTLFQASLGQAQGPTIPIYIDDDSAPPPGDPAQNHRAWYDGVGVELVRVIPEPTSGLMLGFGALVAGLARRNRAA